MCLYDVSLAMSSNVIVLLLGNGPGCEKGGFRTNLDVFHEIGVMLPPLKSVVADMVMQCKNSNNGELVNNVGISCRE